MATVNDIYTFLDQKAPFAIQEDFDNAGFLVGKGTAPVHRALVALDITPEVIREAAEQRAELIVAHHPVIWGKIASVTDADNTGRKLLSLIEHGIAAICAHTNLDAVEGGVNSALAQRLGLKDVTLLEQAGAFTDGVPYGIGRVGELEQGPVSPSAFGQWVKQALCLDGVRFMPGTRPIRRVAVGGGACGSMLPQAAALGCDAFVTADLKHDLYLEAKELGLTLVDAGHFSTEAVVCPILQSWLLEAFPDLQVSVSAVQKEVFSYL